jgi:hypothetical protein
MSKHLPEVLVQWIQVDVFYRYSQIVVAVIAASAGGFSYMDPVCCLVAGALEPVSFYKGFQKIDSMPVFLLPVR